MLSWGVDFYPPESTYFNGQNGAQGASKGAQRAQKGPPQSFHPGWLDKGHSSTQGGSGIPVILPVFREAVLTRNGPTLRAGSRSLLWLAAACLRESFTQWLRHGRTPGARRRGYMKTMYCLASLDVKRGLMSSLTTLFVHAFGPPSVCLWGVNWFIWTLL